MPNTTLSSFSLRRSCSVLMMAAMTAGSVSACGNSAPPPAVDDTRTGSAPAADKGMTTKKKVVLLAGAAALYYLYKKHQSAASKEGPEGQYYLSKNGRVYYRDAEHRAHWVTPPAEGIEVPESEAADYRGFQGYDRSATGKDLTGLGTDPDSP